MADLAASHPELALVAAACRWPHDAAAVLAMREAVSPTMDWSHVLAVARKHRVVPLLHRGLKAAGIEPPAAVTAELQNEATTLAATALRMARESVRLQAAFEAAAIRTCIVKGSPMALLAYGDLGAKQSWDIDLFCSPRDVSAARRLIEGEGYELRHPHFFEPDLMSRFAELEKECGFYHPVRDIWLELHWRFIDSTTLLPGLTVDGDTQDVPLGGATLRTLGDGALFAYLSVHGTVHGWSRLKWLADVAGWLSGKSPDEVSALYHEARRLEAGHAPAVALLLSRQLLDLPIPKGVECEIERNRIARWLADESLAQIRHGRGAADVRPFSWLSWQSKISSLLLGGTMRHLMSDLRFQWTSSGDRMMIKLPAQFDFLYHGLRLPLWLWRRARSARRDD